MCTLRSEFVDIAGLVKGANEGEGLGNQFLANIREADAICEVVRYFKDPNVMREVGRTGEFVDPAGDADTIMTELILADMGTLEKQLPKLEKEAKRDKELMPKFEVAKRLLALGIILGLWHFTYGGPDEAGIVGIILAILSGALAAVFHVGISRAKKNVAAILRAAGIDLAIGRPIDEKTGKPIGAAKEQKAPAKRSAASDFAQAKQALKILYGRQPQKK